MPQAQDRKQDIDVKAEVVDSQQLGPNQFVLPVSGLVVTDLSEELTGETYFQWQQKLLTLTGGDRKNLGKTMEANKWLAIKMFEVEGEKLDVMRLHKMPFKDIAYLMGKVSGFMAVSQQGET